MTETQKQNNCWLKILKQKAEIKFLSFITSQNLKNNIIKKFKVYTKYLALI